MKTLMVNLKQVIRYACPADKRRYRHDRCADKRLFRHNRYSDKRHYRHDCRADSQCHKKPEFYEIDRSSI